MAMDIESVLGKADGPLRLMCFWLGFLRPLSAMTGLIMLFVSQPTVSKSTLNMGHFFWTMTILNALWQFIGVCPALLIYIYRPDGLRWGKVYLLADVIISCILPTLHFSLWGIGLPLACYLYLQYSEDVQRLFAERNPLEI